MQWKLSTILIAFIIITGFAVTHAQSALAQGYIPTRITKAIELLENDQPIYYTQVNGGGYDEGKAMAQTWADYIPYNMEHSPFDTSE